MDARAVVGELGLMSQGVLDIHILYIKGLDIQNFGPAETFHLELRISPRGKIIKAILAMGLLPLMTSLSPF